MAVTMPAPVLAFALATLTKALAAEFPEMLVRMSAAVEVIAPELSVAKVTVIAVPATPTVKGWLSAPGSTYWIEMASPPEPAALAVYRSSLLAPAGSMTTEAPALMSDTVPLGK